jgi:hypothetical protein
MANQFLKMLKKYQHANKPETLMEYWPLVNCLKPVIFNYYLLQQLFT